MLGPSGQALPAGLLHSPRALFLLQRPGKGFQPAEGTSPQGLGKLPERWQILLAGLVSPHEALGLLQQEHQVHPARGVTPHEGMSLLGGEQCVRPARRVSPHEGLGLLQEQLQGYPAQGVTSEPRLGRTPQFMATPES